MAINTLDWLVSIVLYLGTKLKVKRLTKIGMQTGFIVFHRKEQSWMWNKTSIRNVPLSTLFTKDEWHECISFPYCAGSWMWNKASIKQFWGVPFPTTSTKEECCKNDTKSSNVPYWTGVSTRILVHRISKCFPNPFIQSSHQQWNISFRAY